MEGVRLRAEPGKLVQNWQGGTDAGVPVAHAWKLKLRERQKLPKAAQSGTAEPGAASGPIDSSLGSSCHSCFLFLDPEAELSGIAKEPSGDTHILVRVTLTTSGGKHKMIAAYFSPKKVQRWEAQN